MSTHTTPHLDRKVLLALVPLASLAASHEGNPNAHGPVNFSEIAQRIVASAEASSSSSSSSHATHSTHLTPSLLHGIIPSVTTTTTTSSPTSDSGADHQIRTETVWATVVEQTQVVTVVKTLTPDHQSTTTSSQSWPKGYCTGKGEVAVNGKCVLSTMVTSTIPTRGTTSTSPGETSSSLSFTISSTSSSTASPTSTTNNPITTSTTSTTGSISTSTSTSTDTDPLVIIPVTGTVTDLINYDTYTVPASLPPLPPLLPPPGPRPSATSKSSSSSISDDGPLEIIPVTGTVTDLVDYETVMVPSATATTVVVIPVSSSSTTKSQDMGHMLGHIQGMGPTNRVVVHPTVSVGDRLTVVSGSDGSTTITRASPMASASSATNGEDSDAGGEFCKEE